jgi:hypothetical protein
MEFSCLIEKKITTTPLLEFLRQRRVERQRLRDERREERRRKEQERKRLKDADRDRRRGTGKPDTGSSRDATSDSVLRVSIFTQPIIVRCLKVTVSSAPEHCNKMYNIGEIVHRIST